MTLPIPVPLEQDCPALHEWLQRWSSDEAKGHRREMFRTWRGRMAAARRGYIDLDTHDGSTLVQLSAMTAVGHVNTEEIKIVKVSRNEPCPCESGKKYKKCCGRN